MDRELVLDALPAPGEPLQYSLDENNKSLLDASIAERIERQKSRLTRRQYKKLSRRRNKLMRVLIDGNYNALIVARWTTYQDYEQAKYKHHNGDNTRLLKMTLLSLQAEGQRITKELAPLLPVVKEFEEIDAQLKNHNELIAWETEDAQNFEAFKKEAKTWEAQLISAFKQSPRLHHRGQDRDGKEFIDVPKIEEIVVKDDRVLYRIKTTGQTVFEKFLGRWHSALPYGVDVSALVSEETLQNLSVSCNRIVTVERSKRGTNLFYVISRLDSPDGIPDKVLYQKIIDWYPINDHSKTPWACGVTNDRKIEWYNFEDNPHVLIAGATQGGKSNHVNQMIATLVTMNTPAELRVLLVDLKGGIEFTHWRGLQHQLKPMLTSPSKVLDGLQWLRELMERRLTAFESVKAKNLTSYNEKAKIPLPRIICIVDEMATLIGLGDLTKDLHTELRVLSAQGRAVGINLVLCTQHSSVDVLPGWVKTNMGLRISAKMPSHQASMVILDSVSASLLPNIPGRMVFSSGRFEVVAQSPYISDDQIAGALIQANKFPRPDNTEFIHALPPPVVALDDQIMTIALEELEGRLGRNDIHARLENYPYGRDKFGDYLNTFRDGIIENGITYQGVKYVIKRLKKSYILTPEETQDDDIAS